MLTKALDWITHHSEPILTARDTWHAAFAASKAAGNATRQSSNDAMSALMLKDRRANTMLPNEELRSSFTAN